MQEAPARFWPSNQSPWHLRNLGALVAQCLPSNSTAWCIWFNRGEEWVNRHQEPASIKTRYLPTVELNLEFNLFNSLHQENWVKRAKNVTFRATILSAASQNPNAASTAALKLAKQKQLGSLAIGRPGQITNTLQISHRRHAASIETCGNFNKQATRLRSSQICEDILHSCSAQPNLSFNWQTSTDPISMGRGIYMSESVRISKLLLCKMPCDTEERTLHFPFLTLDKPSGCKCHSVCLEPSDHGRCFGFMTHPLPVPLSLPSTIPWGANFQDPHQALCKEHLSPKSCWMLMGWWHL